MSLVNTRLALLILASALCCAPSNAQMPVAWPGGRMAITSDGNAHDPDDIGGTPMAIAIMYAAGLSDRLVHVDYANHFVHKGHEGDASKPAMLAEMKASVDGAVARFWKLDPKTVFNCQTDLDESTANFVKQTLRSGHQNREKSGHSNQDLASPRQKWTLLSHTMICASFSAGPIEMNRQGSLAKASFELSDP